MTRPYPKLTPADIKRLRTMVLSEVQFQRQVVRLAKLCGWRVAHFRRVKVQRKGGGTYHETPVAADGKGWPDLVLVHPKKRLLIFAELKTDRGKETPEQLAWQSDLSSAGCVAVTWRPRQWGLIQEVLSGARDVSTGTGT